jgi:hypothetical protein
MFKVLERIGINISHPAAQSLNYLKSTDIAMFPPSPRRLADCGFLMNLLMVYFSGITLAEATDWFGSVVAGTKTGSLDATEIEARWNAFAFSVEGKPKCLFDDALKREVLLKFSWLPTAAEVWALVEPEYAEFQSVLLHLNKILGRPFRAALPSFAEIEEHGWAIDPAAKPAIVSVPIRALSQA